MGLEHYFTISFTIMRKAAASGVWGDESTSQQVAIAKGWLQPGSGKIVYQDGKTVSESTHLLLCPYGIDIKPQDEIISEGCTYRVLGVQDAAGRAHHLEVNLQERI